MIATTQSLGTQSLGVTLLERIGNTPLLRLERLTAHLPGIQILGKVEWVNPGGSIKDRAAASIVLDAEKRGLLKFHQRDGGRAPARRHQRQHRHCVCHAGRRARLSGHAVRAVQRVRGAQAHPPRLRRERHLD